MVNLTGIGLVHGERVLIDGGELLLKPGDRAGLVGPNGAGKTTIFRLITGQEKPDAGSVSVSGGLVVGYFSQDTAEMQGKTALEETLDGAGRVREIGRELSVLEERMGQAEGLSDRDMDRYGELQTEFAARDGWDLENRAETILTGLGIGPERMQRPVESFSGGWKMRISLARILLLQPDVLLMDEPTNHLDVESIQWLESWLQDYKGMLLLTCHDREFMTRICKKTIEISQGKITTYSGDYDFYLQERQVRRDQLIASQKRQEAMLAKEEEFIARFAARASHAAQVQSRVKTIEKIERIVVPPDPKVMKIRFAPCKRSGDVVARLEGLSKTWPPLGHADADVRSDLAADHPDQAVTVFEGLEAQVDRGQRIALTGVNGAGKSTLLKVIAGMTEASKGSCTLGPSVEAGYFSQYSSDVLRGHMTIEEEVSERLPLAPIGAIRNILGAFQFSGDDCGKKVSVLSGGEKSRVMMACILARPVNFLILDEPTNHLDIASREVLLDALKDFEGTLLVVSHDRWFLKHLATRVWHMEAGKLAVYDGDWDWYSRQVLAP